MSDSCWVCARRSVEADSLAVADPLDISCPACMVLGGVPCFRDDAPTLEAKAAAEEWIAAGSSARWPANYVLSEFFKQPRPLQEAVRDLLSDAP